jgi:Bax protein
MPATRGQIHAILLNTGLFLVLSAALSLPAEAHAWTGQPVGYRVSPYGPPVFQRPPAMPARIRPAAYGYPAYPPPGYTPPHRTPVRTLQRAAHQAPATAKTPSPPARSEPPQAADRSGDSHKQLFFDKLLPLVTRENERLLGVRRELSNLQSARTSGRQLPESRLTWLRELADGYRIEGITATDALIEALLERVDVIPAGLALAQAANESAWGTSRFAKEGNNLFGTWTYDTDKGIKPKRRAAGKTHLVRRYDSLEASLRDYMQNLNSHPAYQPFRERRAAQRAKRQPLSALRLAAGLTAYAENGDEYVELIQSMIRSNKLEHITQLQVADAG